MREIRLSKMVDRLAERLPEDPDFAVNNLAGSIAIHIGGTRNGAETERVRELIVGQFAERLASKVLQRDANPGIDRADIIEQVVREAGIHREREVAQWRVLISDLLAKKQPVALEVNEAIHPIKPIKSRYEREGEILALRRGDHRPDVNDEPAA